jgi:hypothetical protein
MDQENFFNDEISYILNMVYFFKSHYFIASLPSFLLLSLSLFFLFTPQKFHIKILKLLLSAGLQRR